MRTRPTSLRRRTTEPPHPYPRRTQSAGSGGPALLPSLAAGRDIRLSAAIWRSGRAGLPATLLPAGRDRVTVEPAETDEPRPMTRGASARPFTTVAPAP